MTLAEALQAYTEALLNRGTDESFRAAEAALVEILQPPAAPAAKAKP